MAFNSFSFILLFPVIFLLYYCIPARMLRLRNVFLLLLGYALYMSCNPSYALVLLFVTVSTYSFSMLMRALKGRRRRLAVVCGTVVSLFPLMLFKYWNFIAASVMSAISMCGMSVSMPGLNWAIPVGISFFSLQALGYMFDVYYRRIDVERDFLSYALFVSFFPSILSGPINKASLVLPQIKNLRVYFDYTQAVSAMKSILWGMFMKVVVADRISLCVTTFYNGYDHFSGSTCLLASILYSIQIYSDFAGYSLIAVGIGKLLGFELTNNFRRPYFSVSVTDFWRRWHISLSMWLRDYVYIPLGGNRCGKGRNYWNIFVTFLVSGIWHGANWTFIVWGVWHGVFQIIEKFLGQQGCRYSSWWMRAVKITFTFIVVNFAWILFRSPDFVSAFSFMGRIFDFGSYADFSLPDNTTSSFALLGVLMLFVKDFTDEFFPSRFKLLNSRNLYVRWLSYILLIMVIMFAGVFDASQFIYAMF